MKVAAIRLSVGDDVANVLAETPKGAQVDCGADTPAVTAQEALPKHHKIALTAISQGAHVIRGGLPIGIATADIPAGGHVHVHNLTSLRARSNKGNIS